MDRMEGFTQANYPLQVTTELGPDTFALVSLQGEEGISRPFAFTLDLLAVDPEIDGQALLRTPASIEIATADGETAYFHGLIRRFVQLGQAQGLTSYRAEIVPWLALLGLHRDCRIFQEKSVPEILEAVFGGHGFADFDLRLSATYPAREYCVQYRESDLDFVSRLMEEEGIHYFFEHESDRHVLVIADNSPLAPACDGGRTPIAVDPREDADTVLRFHATHDVFVGAVEFRDFDFEQAPAPLVSSVSGDGDERVYDYHPGRFTTRDEGDRYARLALESDEAWRHVVQGSGNCRRFRSGHRFDLAGHYRRDLNAGYLITHVSHSAAGGHPTTGDGGAFEYDVAFSAIPVDVPFRPRRTTPGPHVSGSQTAIVVGKEGEEIWVDRFGRVKVKFHWDRDQARDEGSSCWVRVSTGWAGKSWGSIQIPRIGEEVIVDFLEGDPDRPIIIGRVYNADHMPPWELPANKTRSGVKSRSSKDAEARNSNEIRFEDLKGKEQIYIRAEKDKVVVVENDRTETVGHDETILVKNDRTETVENNETITIGVDREEEVGGNETIAVKGDRTADVDGNETVTVQGNRTARVKGSESGQVDGDSELKVSGKRNEKVTGAITVVSGNRIEIKAATALELKVGPSSIKIDSSGITLKGPQIKIEGSAKAEMKAPLASVKGDAMVVVEAGGATRIKGGILMAEGGIVKIN